jgi:hypothetical protein
VGNAINKSDILTPGSTPQQFTDASANYIKATQDAAAASDAGNLGSINQKQLNTDIAQNYSYVGVSDDSGALAVKADSSMVAGGNISVVANNGTLTYSNGTAIKQDTYPDQGFHNSQSAIPAGTAMVSTYVLDSAGQTLVAPQEAQLSNAQLVAQNAIVQQNQQPAEILAAPNEFTPSQTASFVASDSADAGAVAALISPPPAAATGAGADPAAVTPIAPVTAGGYQEDAPAASGSTADYASLANARAQEIADANNLSAQDPNSLPAPPGFRPGSSDQLTVANGVNAPTTTTTVSNSSGPIGTNSTQVVKEKPNPLHDYVNWTYKFSLYAVPKDTMNQITQGLISPGGEDSITAASQLILSSGGSPTDAKGTYWKQDFYIDNVNLKSVVGLSHENRNTDVQYIKFDVIEPYTITFLPRLLATAQDINGVPDWGMGFYLLKIEFLGYNENGLPTRIPATTKYIPISFQNLSYSVTPKGTVYSITATPCSLQSQTPLDNHIPFHMELTGGTMDEIFNGAATQATAQNSSTNPDRAAGKATGTATTTGAQQGAQTFTKGVAEAMNGWEKFVVEHNNQVYPNTYKFSFLNGLGDNRVIDPNTWSNVQNIRMANAKDKAELAAGPKGGLTIDKAKGVFRVQAGTKITDLISSVMQTSDYMSKQYAKPSPKDKPLYMFKIVPLVKFGPMDPITNMWQRDVEYRIVPYVIYGSDANGFGQKSPPGAVKSYKWMFTGQSKDIIDLKFDIKTAFFNLRNAGEPGALESADKSSTAKAADHSPEATPRNSLNPTRYKNVAGLPQMSHTGNRNVNEKTVAVEELFKKQFEQESDNITLDITIVGDPDLIQQDNGMYGTNQPNSKTIFDSGSVNFQYYEAYFNLDFVAPLNDYDEGTGLFQVQSANAEMFNGLYRIITVESHFRGGRFTQQLKNARVKIQSNQSTQKPGENGSGISGSGGAATGAGGSSNTMIGPGVSVGGSVDIATSALNNLTNGGVNRLTGAGGGILGNLVNSAAGGGIVGAIAERATNGVLNLLKGSTGNSNSDQAARTDTPTPPGILAIATSTSAAGGVPLPPTRPESLDNSTTNPDRQPGSATGSITSTNQAVPLEANYTDKGPDSTITAQQQAQINSYQGNIDSATSTSLQAKQSIATYQNQINGLRDQLNNGSINAVQYNAAVRDINTQIAQTQSTLDTATNTIQQNQAAINQITTETTPIVTTTTPDVFEANYTDSGNAYTSTDTYTPYEANYTDSGTAYESPPEEPPPDDPIQY